MGCKTSTARKAPLRFRARGRRIETHCARGAQLEPVARCFQGHCYHDGESGRFSLIPWDLDKSLWYPEPNFWSDNAPNGLNISPNWNVVSKSCDGYQVWFDNLGKPYRMMPIDCDPLMRHLRDQIYANQKAMVERFIAGPFSEASVRAKLDAWRAQITDAIQDDPLVDSAHS
jgi:hypothetical protein